MDLHLYPTTLSRDRSMHETARAHKVLFDHRHFTYAELTERLYGGVETPGRLLEHPAQTVFVRHSLTATLGEAPSPGLVAEYRAVIDELKGAGLTVDDLASATALLDPAVAPSTRQTLQQLIEVLRCYQGCLAHAGLVDQGDRDLAVVRRLRQHLADGTKPAVLHGVRRIVVHSVYHLSLVHYALVSLLLKLVDEGGVLQHFSSGLNIDAVTFAEFTWQRFVADESLAALVLPEFATPRPRGGNLESLCERLFSRGSAGEALEPDGTVKVVAAPGRAREVESIARHIRETLARGVSPGQIAIVVRNLDRYGDILESVCRRYLIPLWFRRGMPLFHVPLVKLLFSLLDLADSTYPRATLLKLLGSSYLRPEEPWPDDIVGLVNAVGYLDRTHVPLPVLLEAYLRRQQPPEAEAHRITALARWVEALQTKLDDLSKTPRPFLAYLESLKSLLTHLGFWRAMGLHPEVPLPVVQRDREAMRRLFDTLWAGAEAMQWLGDTALAFTDFRLLAIDLLRDVGLEQPAPAAGAVRVLGVRDLVGLDFDYVFVPGLADTEFPQHYTEHPVLDDRARQALNPAARLLLAEKFAGLMEPRLLGKILLTTADKAREEPLLFFLALEAANQTCVLSYPSRTADGEAIYPSLFIDEVQRHFPAVDGQSLVLERSPALPSVPALAECLEPGEMLRRAAMAWRLDPESSNGWSPWEAALHSHGVMVERLRALARIEAARKRYLLRSGSAADLDPSPFGDIGRQIDLRRRCLDPQQPWSPTMLEDAAICPFMFFSRHVLRLAPRLEPDYDVRPATLGQLAHDILAEFFHTDPPDDAATARQHMRTIAGQVLAKHQYDPRIGHPGFWQVRRAELLAVLDDLAAYLASRQVEAYRTYYHERDLAGAALRASWSIALQGRVDRVAIRQGPSGITGILVQDFKYSGNHARYRGQLNLETLGHTSFQLPIYLYLTLQQMMRDGYQIVPDAELRLEYLLLKEPKRRPLEAAMSASFLDPTTVGGLFDGIQRLTEMASAGRFAPDPIEPTQTCTHCAFATLCRYWTSGAGAEAWRDPEDADEGV